MGFATSVSAWRSRLERSSTGTGLILVLIAYSAFALHDALVKILVAHFDAPQILFMRSLTVVVLCLGIGGRSVVHRGLFSPMRNKLLVRAVLTFIAWLLYYSAGRYLGLAQMITIYFASPLIIAVMAGPLLGERVTLVRWVALGIGFVGVLLAARPHGSSPLLPAICVALAAVIWAYAMILMRQVSKELRGWDQVFVIAMLFLICCGAMMPFIWKTPSLPQLALMLGLGLLSTAAQLLLIEGVKLAQASVIAPMEFSGLLWSFVLGFIFFGDIPAASVFLGAALILLSGGLVVLSEIRASRLKAA
ncbi:DMT family transporter [Acidisoma cellulosilytica]|uniref:DMT family transporter n=1 Tax=Acidisoma cellulosilyticum TaxID=2802395 RepID=A0A964E593_9PROT|nr:DMT family transporter [Acidisoma cellulosilyticum]MCB8882301.1 DMT family transporter [Acidisoma cellulosilyticum]